jgi:hypothetical protein
MSDSRREDAVLAARRVDKVHVETRGSLRRFEGERSRRERDILLVLRHRRFGRRGLAIREEGKGGSVVLSALLDWWEESDDVVGGSIFRGC